MWGRLSGTVLILGYFGFAVKSLFEATAPPSCQNSQNCVRPHLHKAQQFDQHVFLSNAPIEQFQFKTVRGLPLLAPVTNTSTVLYLGSVRTSLGSVHHCTANRIFPGRSETPTVAPEPLSFLRRKLFRTPGVDCVVSFRHTLRDSAVWRSNDTQVFLSVTSTDPVSHQMLFRPISTPLSIVYHPEAKRKTKRRYLLQPKRKVLTADATPLFGGASYRALPKKVKVGPIKMFEQLDRLKLQSTGRGYWIDRKTGQSYIPDLYVNTLVSPRDEYQALPYHTSTTDPVSLTIELDTVSWRKYAIENLMLDSLSKMEQQFGTNQYDTDSMKLLLAGENPIVLFVTLLVSVLHMLFEFLAMSSNWSYFNAATQDAQVSNKVSSRAILLDLLFEAVILGWLWDEGEAKIVQLMLGCKILFNVWRYRKLTSAHRLNAALEVGGKKKGEAQVYSLWTGLSVRQLRAMREVLTPDRFERDALASLSVLLVPVLLGLASYQLLWVPQKSWVSWMLKTGALSSYAGGFVAMTPQLYKNFYFQSVEHLPWTTLTYQFLNTIIDDLFSFLIRMPNAHRLSVFRDDIIFVIYWLQKRHYRGFSAGTTPPPGKGDQIKPPENAALLRPAATTAGSNSSPPGEACHSWPPTTTTSSYKRD